MTLCHILKRWRRPAFEFTYVNYHRLHDLIVVTISNAATIESIYQLTERHVCVPISNEMMSLFNCLAFFNVFVYLLPPHLFILSHSVRMYFYASVGFQFFIYCLRQRLIVRRKLFTIVIYLCTKEERKNKTYNFYFYFSFHTQHISAWHAIWHMVVTIKCVKQCAIKTHMRSNLHLSLSLSYSSEGL